MSAWQTCSFILPVPTLNVTPVASTEKAVLVGAVPEQENVPPLLLVPPVPPPLDWLVVVPPAPAVERPPVAEVLVPPPPAVPPELLVVVRLDPAYPLPPGPPVALLLEPPFVLPPGLADVLCPALPPLPPTMLLLLVPAPPLELATPPVAEPPDPPVALGLLDAPQAAKPAAKPMVVIHPRGVLIRCPFEGSRRRVLFGRRALSKLRSEIDTGARAAVNARTRGW
jgi:hypothetical protein